MWEAIQANRSRSAILLLLIGVILLTFGACAGMALGPRLGFGAAQIQDPVPASAAAGAGLALAVWIGGWLFALYGGERLILHSAGARRIQKGDHPRLWNVVEEMSIAAGLDKPPAVYVVDDSAPNAFAVGCDRRHGSVAFTSGLLRMMSRDELQGVAAHEIAHVANEDIRFMTLAATLVGGVELLSRAFLHIGPFAASGRRSSHNSRGGLGGHPALMGVAVVLAVLSPIIVRLLYLACSRSREYLADACAVQFTRYPEGLASALEKMAAGYEGSSPGIYNGAVAALYIVNPLESTGLSGMASTHPPTHRRIAALRGMGGRAGMTDYAAALERVETERKLLTPLELAARTGKPVTARSAGPRETEQEALERARETVELIDRFAGYIPLPCRCGMTLKIPPDFRGEEVSCPRCKTSLRAPRAEAVSDALPKTERTEEIAPLAATASDGSLQFTRRSDAWESFRCPCGQTIQLGPDYPLDYTVCAQCNRRIAIRTSAGATVNAA
ncbi:MAG: M48 family metalloprotease [Acidobacteria bacterium]|nr:M48 family metalloprotease [Acidobacteriota bacterium]